MSCFDDFIEWLTSEWDKDYPERRPEDIPSQTFYPDLPIGRGPFMGRTTMFIHVSRLTIRPPLLFFGDRFSFGV